MAETVQVDELSIKLSSAIDSSLINNLKSMKDGLNGLNSALGKLSGNSGAVQAISSIASGFSTLSSSINGLDASKVKAVTTAINKFGNKSATQAVSNLPKLATAIADFNQEVAKGGVIPTAATASLTSVAESVSKIGGKGGTTAVGNLPKLASELTQFANSMASMPEIPFTTISDLGLMSERIGKFGGKSATNAVALMPQFGSAVKQLLTDISTAPPIDPTLAQTIEGLSNLNANAIKGLIQLSEQSEKSSKKVNLLKKAFQGVASVGGGFVKAIKNGASALAGLRNHTSASQTGFAQLTKSIVMVRTAIWGVKRVINAFSSSINLASDLIEINNVVDHVFGNYTAKLEEMAETSIRDFGISELTMKKYASKFQAMGSTMGITDSMVSSAIQSMESMGKAIDDTGKYAYESTGHMEDMAMSMTEWVADIASFYDMDYSEAAEKAQAIYTGMARPLRSIGVDLTQTNLKAWALANGLNADIENMTQAEKATLRFQYALSVTSAATGDFTRTAGRMCAA